MLRRTFSRLSTAAESLTFTKNWISYNGVQFSPTWVRDQDLLDRTPTQQRISVIRPDKRQIKNIDYDEAEKIVTVHWDSPHGAHFDVQAPRSCKVPLAAFDHHENMVVSGFLDYSKNGGGTELWNCPDKVPWLGDCKSNNIQGPIEYGGSFTPELRKQVMIHMEKYGYALVSGLPVEKKDGRDYMDPKTVEEFLSNQFKVFKNTHYGKFYVWGPREMVKEKAYEDAAYDTIAIDLHTDSTYWHDSPRVQSFNCFDYNAVGGDTMLADGLYAAEEMSMRHPEYAMLLERHPVLGQVRKEGNVYEASRLVIDRDPVTNKVQQISFNNSDREPFLPTQTKLAEAYAIFNDIVHSSYIRFPLRPGTIMMFDNHRVLHARDSFKGLRRMCGSYISLDEYNSTLKASKAAVPAFV